MNEINWSTFNGESFQSFCNLLLSFEISKRYVGFSAAGKDKGIDGWYEGDYLDLSGKWRFQVKFHRTSRKEAVSLLKSQIKKDIQENVLGENNLVFITNSELLPQDRKSIIETAKKTLKEIQRTDVNFDIWDGSKIFNLIVRHPLLKFWLDEGAKYQLQNYKDFFDKELTAELTDNYTLNNKFYFRDSVFISLENFLKSSSSIAIVDGEAGIGKTRVCIEFFKKYIDTDENWIALVLVTKNIDVEKLERAIFGEKNFIIFIDDAQNFSPRDVAELKVMVERKRTNKVKLLLTARDFFINEIIGEIKEYKLNEITSISLTSFSSEQTAEILKNELEGSVNLNLYLNTLTQITFGKPIMIIILLKAIKNGISLDKIRQDDFLTNYVLNYFDRFASSIQEIEKKKIREVIDVFSLLEPLQIENNDFLNEVSLKENISVKDIESICKGLKHYKFISGVYEHSIKPDYYSDIILIRATNNKKWLEEKIVFYPTYINNIIRNLIRIDSPKNNYPVLIELLSFYIDLIDKCDSQLKLDEILNTVYSIAYSKPLVAIGALKKVIKIYENPEHPLNKEITNAINRNENYLLNSIFNISKNILEELNQLKGYYFEVFQLTSQLYLITKDKGLTSIIAFNKEDHHRAYNSGKHSSYSKQLHKILENGESDLIDFAFECISKLLQLEFTGSESNPFQKHSITITTYYIQEIPENVSLRISYINLLIKFYYSTKNPSYQKKALDIILGVPGTILSIRKREQKYKGTREFEIVLNFLFALSTIPLSIKEKQSIKEKLYWYGKWGIDKTYTKKILEIENNLIEKDLTERLYQLFNPRYEIGVKKSQEEFNIKCKEIIEGNSIEEIGNSLYRIVRETETIPHLFYDFPSHITRQYPIKAKELINFLWTVDSNFIIDYFSYPFQILYFSENEEEFYWNYINKIFSDSNAASFNFILRIYNGLNTVQNEIIRNKLSNLDGKLISNINNAKLQGTFYQLAFALPTLFFIDKKAANKEIRFFLQVCDERDVDHLFLVLNDLGDNYYSEIKDLILKETLKFKVSHNMEESLNNIIIREEFDEVLQYFLNRFDYKRNNLANSKMLFAYEFVPKYSNHSIFRNLPLETQNNIFNKVLKWFVAQKFESIETMYSDDILEFCKPGNFISNDIAKLYSSYVNKYSNDFDKILNIAKSLNVFEDKNEEMVDLIASIIEISTNTFSKHEELKKIKSECYLSLISMGVKSGTPGQPFEVDLQLRDLLIKSINKLDVESHAARTFLKEVLDSVEKNIERDSEERGEAW